MSTHIDIMLEVIAETKKQDNNYKDGNRRPELKTKEVDVWMQKRNSSCQK